MLTAELIQEASLFLDGTIRRTPLELSPELSDKLGVNVWLKLENWQITGSFKVRAALFALSKLQGEGINRVATCSAGNHGLGMLWAARELRMEVMVFVPQSVDPMKAQAMSKMGGTLQVSRFNGYDETEKWARHEADRMNIPFQSAFDDDRVMAANGGSMAIEVLEQAPSARTFVLPTGGGGLAGGFAFHAKSYLPDSRIVVCQHRDSAGFLRSMEKGAAVTELAPIETLAHGLEGGFGVKTFEILRSRHDEIRLVDEASLRSAMRWMIQHHRMIVEGSSAVAVAACLQEDFRVEGGEVVVVITGRNVSAEQVHAVTGSSTRPS